MTCGLAREVGPGAGQRRRWADGRGRTASGYLLVALTGLAGLAGLIAWWRFADQT